MIMKKMNFGLLLALSMIFIVSTTGFAADLSNSRMMPENKVIVSQDGKAIAEYTKEMPVPEGALLTCQGKCAVKLDDVLLVAEDQSQFSIDTKNNQRVLNVQKGTVYFGLSKMPRTVVFLTPVGVVSADKVFINASSGNNMLEGYVKSSGTSSEVGVLGGGSLPLNTSDGVKVLKPGQRFLLAQADMGSGGSGGGGNGGSNLGGLSNGQIAGIGVGVVAAGGIGYAIKRNNDDDGDGSPSNP